jgi:protein involved in plasmid replication-relaxation
MAGSERSLKEQPSMVIQERDRHLLREVAVMRVIDREQAKIVAGFGSTTRANARLLALTRARLLRRFFLGTTAGGAKALYALSEKGARLVGVPETGPRRRQDEAVVADFFIQHQLATNEVYCALKYSNRMPAGIAFKRWMGFPKRPVPGLRLIPDGYIELETPSVVVAAFLEVDLGHERSRVWRDKVRNYLDLAVTGNFEREFKQHRFRVLVVADSERRLSAIRQVVFSATDKIFWFATFESIRNHGIFASVWQRAKGEEPQSLIREIP